MSDDRDQERLPPALSADAVRVRLGRTVILDDISVCFRRGGVTALVGPNGSGKSTLLRTLARLLRPESGTIHLSGDDLHSLGTRDLARKLALLPQGPAIPSGITVRELVGYGRYAHQGPFRRPGRADADAIEWAVDVTGLGGQQERFVDSLSGGERQRAWIAMALAQKSDLLLLDEPTTYLDMRHQIEVLALLRRLNATLGLTVVWVLHDLNQAAAYSDLMVLMRDGRIVRTGPPDEIMRPDVVRAAFDFDVVVVPHPSSGRPVCLPIEQAEDSRPC